MKRTLASRGGTISDTIGKDESWQLATCSHLDVPSSNDHLKLSGSLSTTAMMTNYKNQIALLPAVFHGVEPDTSGQLIRRERYVDLANMALAIHKMIRPA
jgi:hypothetical protein